MNNEENSVENNQILQWIVEFYKNHTNDLIDGVMASLIANYIWMIPSFIVSTFSIIWLYKKYKSTVESVGFQTYIFGEVSYVVGHNDSYKICDIPNLLLSFRNRLNLGTKKNKDEVYFWETRISTFILFTDGKRVLLFNRKNNPHKEAIHNPKMDVYGAKAFHNNSLEYKIPSSFMESEITAMHSIPGIVIEENKVSLKEFIKNIFKNETAIMIGFIAYIHPEDLEKGIETENKIDNNDNLILPLVSLSVEDDNLTAKARIGIKYLHSLYNKIDYEKKCAEYCGKKPFTYNIDKKIFKDDLTKISGIGYKIEKLLNSLGIYKFEQISNWTDDNIEWIENYLYFPGKIKREEWIKQSKEMIEL